MARRICIDLFKLAYSNTPRAETRYPPIQQLAFVDSHKVFDTEDTADPWDYDQLLSIYSHLDSTSTLGHLVGRVQALSTAPLGGPAYLSNRALRLRNEVLHEKLDELREMKWSELITMQQEQLRLLTQRAIRLIGTSLALDRI